MQDLTSRLNRGKRRLARFVFLGCVFMMGACSTGLSLAPAPSPASPASPSSPRAPGAVGRIQITMESTSGSGLASGKQHYVVNHDIGSTFSVVMQADGRDFYVAE